MHTEEYSNKITCVRFVKFQGKRYRYIYTYINMYIEIDEAKLAKCE